MAPLLSAGGSLDFPSNPYSRFVNSCNFDEISGQNLNSIPMFITEQALQTPWRLYNAEADGSPTPRGPDIPFIASSSFRTIDSLRHQCDIAEIAPANSDRKRKRKRTEDSETPPFTTSKRLEHRRKQRYSSNFEDGNAVAKIKKIRCRRATRVAGRGATWCCSRNKHDYYIQWCVPK